MRFGFHCSIAGGLFKALERAKALECDTVQFFTRNPRGWRYSPLDPKEVNTFRHLARALDLSPLVVHMPYLPNLSTPDPGLYARSVESLKVEVTRCRELGVNYLVTHVGRATDGKPRWARRRVARALMEALELEGPMILLENTAGQGLEIGAGIAELGSIIELAGGSPRLGLCLDTAHAFQAGYPIHRPEGLEALMAEVNCHVGLGRLRLIHLNDSKTPLGSHVDRHWHIGEGEIGLDGLKRIVNHPLLRDLPAIMETPYSLEWDKINMGRVRALSEDLSLSSEEMA